MTLPDLDPWHVITVCVLIIFSLILGYAISNKDEEE